MAGEWIPIRMDLCDDPAVIAISEYCGISENETIGALVKVWSWANRHLVDGHAASVTEKWIDRYTNVDSLGSAMLKSGWLEKHDGHVVFPKFDRWNSKGAKTRLLANRRQSESRSKRDICHADSVTKPSTREEKRREEKNKENTPLPPVGGSSSISVSAAGGILAEIPKEIDSPKFREAWSEWVADRKDRKKPITQRAAKQQLKSLIPLGPAKATECLLTALRNGWTGIFPESKNGKQDSPAPSYPSAPAEDKPATLAEINAQRARQGLPLIPESGAA